MCYRNEEKEGLIFSIKIERIRVKIGERGMICSFICMLDLVMFEFDIIPCIVSDWKYLVIFSYCDTPPVCVVIVQSM